MSSAVAELPVAPPAAAAPSWPQRFASLDRSARLRLGAAAALLVAGVVAAIFFSRQPDYRVLFANLNDKDGGAIVAQLSQMNVPYKYAEGAAPSWCRPSACTTCACAWPRRACPRVR